MTLDSFQNILNSQWSRNLPKIDKIIHGTILRINKHFLTIDIGGKESIQLPWSSVENKMRNIQIHDKVLLHSDEIMGLDQRTISLYNIYPSLPNVSSDEILKILSRNKSYVNGLILNEVKGGYSVGLGGIVAFLPKSQISLPLPLNQMKNYSLSPMKTFSILNIDLPNKNIVVSRLKVIQHHHKAKEKMKGKMKDRFKDKNKLKNRIKTRGKKWN